MRYLVLFLLFSIFNHVSGQENNCDSLFQKAIQQEQSEGFEKCEKQFLNILSICPDQYDTHTEIINFYETY